MGLRCEIHRYGCFFGRVVTVHPVTPKSRTIELDDTHVIHEFGRDRWPGAARSRVLRLAWAPLPNRPPIERLDFQPGPARV